MYSTCLFCHESLGGNGILASFPIGRRLAFDAQRGRLWIVCLRCQRWNLSPLEERWETVEACERAYRRTTLRASTAEIGLARMADGLELVRIGKPTKPEMAAWRYGRELLRRRWLGRLDVGTERAVRRAAPVLAAGVVALTPLASLAAYAAIGAMAAVERWYDSERPIARVIRPGRGEGPVIVRQRHLSSAELVRETHQGVPGWRLRMQTERGAGTWRGTDADRTLGSLLARMNRAGASQHQVEQALAKIDWFGGGDGVYAFGSRYGAFPRGYEQRLAMEMVSHDTLERQALEGELAALEAAWREAEEIAAIADDLLEPSALTSRLEQLRSARQRAVTDATA
jgi:hypothetical protein